jgi:undecaprenyl-diphosphatase
MSVDLWLFKVINGLAGHTPVLDQLMQAVVSDYVGPTLQVLALLGFWFEGTHAPERRKNQRAVLLAVLALVVSGAVVALCNLFYFRDRPFRYHEVNLLFYYPSDSSFPSNSVTVLFSMAAAIWLRNRAWGWPLILLAGAFALARVYCGVHYPLDVLVGSLLGAATAWFLTRHRRYLYPALDVIIGVARRLYLA